MNITKQPVLNIGLVGHIDHGKTTLLYKLSGKWTDTHSEELKRGITIKLGYADIIIKKCKKCNKFTIKDTCDCGGSVEEVEYVSFVDVPGHEMLMATMLSGAAIIDAALLIIAANEPCPRPQTKEHLIALGAKGINNIIIVQNKIDLVTQEGAEKSYQDIKAFVKDTIAENAPIIPVSAQQNVNIEEVLRAITELPIPERDTKSDPLFFVARSFDINKPGTEVENISGGVLGGILKQGIIHVGEAIEIKPGVSEKKHNETIYKTLKTKIKSIRSGKNELQEAIPSGSLAIETDLSPELTKSDSLIGCIAGIEGKLPEVSYRIKLKTNLFKEVIGVAKEQAVENIKMGELLLLSVNTTTTVGTTTRVKGDEIELSLKIPLMLIKNSKAGIARNLEGHWRLIGWGEVI